MSYYLFKLRFLAPLCAGDGEDARGLERAASTIGGDTLFAALCQEALAQGGVEALEELAGWAREDRLRLSDLLPYAGEDLLIPRPVLPRAAPACRPQGGDAAPQDRKQLKKLPYIPLAALPDYLAATRGEREPNPAGWHRDYGEAVTRTQTAVSGLDNPLPYTVGAFRFLGMAEGEPACGLYGIVGWAGVGRAIPETLSRLLRGLGVSGIGGKRSAGFGRFAVAEEIFLAEKRDRCPFLWQLLEDREAPGQLLLSTSLPAPDELTGATEGAWYQLRRRGGFINTPGGGSPPVKRRTQYFFAPGSVFPRRYRGALMDLSQGGGHPVYRCSRPLFLGVTP